MRGQNGSVYIRIPFDAGSDPSSLNYMSLGVRFDDGFAAFLNGQLIASANAPGALDWNSFATAGNSDSAAMQFRAFDVSQFVGLLRPGTNLLAIQGLNVSLGSSDFLNDVRLMLAERRIIGGEPAALRYDGPITLNDLMTIKARVLSGAEWSALHEATFVVGNPALVISEVQYHPANPSLAEMAAGFSDQNDFEYVELHNPGAGSFDLAGVRFVDGIEFEFTESAITRLGPGGYVLVVRNQAAFEARYGVGLPVAGEFSGRLSNSGEHLEVDDASGAVLAELTYGTDDPWPVLADGGGPSLELHDLSGDHTAPEHWGVSQSSDGSPGLPTTMDSARIAEVSRSGDQLRLSIQAEAGRTYHVFAAENLTDHFDWRHETAVGPAAADGTAEVLLDMPVGAPRRFFKAMVDIP